MGVSQRKPLGHDKKTRPNASVIAHEEQGASEVSLPKACVNCHHLTADWACDQSGLKIQDPYMDHSDCIGWQEGSSEVSYNGFPACTPEFEDIIRDTVENALRRSQGKKP